MQANTARTNPAASRAAATLRPVVMLSTKTQPTSNKKVAWTRMGIPATLAICQDQRTLVFARVRYAPGPLPPDPGSAPR